MNNPGLIICTFIFFSLYIGTCTPPIKVGVNEIKNTPTPQDTMLGPTAPVSIDSIQFREAISRRINDSNVALFLNCLEDSLNVRLYEAIDRLNTDDSIGFTVNPKNITKYLKKTKGVRDGSYYVSIRFTVKTIGVLKYCNVCYGIVFGPSLSLEWMYDRIGDEIWYKIRQMIQNEISPLLQYCSN